MAYNNWHHRAGPFYILRLAIAVIGIFMSNRMSEKHDLCPTQAVVEVLRKKKCRLTVDKLYVCLSSHPVDCMNADLFLAMPV